MKKVSIESVMGVFLLLLVFGISRQAGLTAAGVNAIPANKNPVVVIDVGHPTSHLCN